MEARLASRFAAPNEVIFTLLSALRRTILAKLVRIFHMGVFGADALTQTQALCATVLAGASIRAANHVSNNATTLTAAATHGSVSSEWP